MCNVLFNNSDRTIVLHIPKSGRGYRLVRVTNPLLAPIALVSYLRNPEGWVEWVGDHSANAPEDNGFCFFTTKREAKRAQNAWNLVPGTCKFSIQRIRYKGGLGKRIERRLIYGKEFMVALCTAWIEAEEVNGKV